LGGEAACEQILAQAGIKPVSNANVAVVMKIPAAGALIPYFDHMADGARLGDDTMIVLSRAGATRKFKTDIETRFGVSNWGELRSTGGILSMLVRTLSGIEVPVSEVTQLQDLLGKRVLIHTPELDALREKGHVLKMECWGGEEGYIPEQFRNSLYKWPVTGNYVLWSYDEASGNDEFLWYRGGYWSRDKERKELVPAVTLKRGGLLIPLRKAKLGGDTVVYNHGPDRPGAAILGYVPTKVQQSLKLPEQLFQGERYIVAGDGDWEEAASRDGRAIKAEVVVG